MEIVHVLIKESGTAGLASAYQKIGNTTLGVSAVATTGGFILIPLASDPWQVPVSEPYDDIVRDVVPIGKDEAVEGYETMSIENASLAEESLPIALEEWPDWKE